MITPPLPVGLLLASYFLLLCFVGGLHDLAAQVGHGESHLGRRLGQQRMGGHAGDRVGLQGVGYTVVIQDEVDPGEVAQAQGVEGLTPAPGGPAP